MDDDLITKLKALCGRLSDNALEGRQRVAESTGLSEQYLYQVITGKPMANGSRRSLGKIARGKISRAFPDWLDVPSGSVDRHRLEQSIAPYQVKSHPKRKLVKNVCEVSEQISDDGLRELIGFAKCLASTHPLVKPKAA